VRLDFLHPTVSTFVLLSEPLDGAGRAVGMLSPERKMDNRMDSAG